MNSENTTYVLDPADFLAAYDRRIVEDGAAEWNEPIVADFRANRGPAGFLAGAPVLLLTTIGARTGQPRTAPLVYTRDGDRYVVLASRAGAPVNPGWYHNVVANSRVTVDLGEETFQAVCSFAEGEERDRLFANHVAQLRNMGEYQSQSQRPFPVVVLERVS